MKKKVLISLAVILLLLAIYGWVKGNKVIAAYEKMTIEPYSISEPKISQESLKFKIDVLLSNPSNEDFDVDGFGIIYLKDITVFYDGVFIANSKVNLTKISIPANDQLVIHDIEVEVPKPLLFFANNLALIYDMVQNFDESKITVNGVLNAAGQKITI